MLFALAAALLITNPTQAGYTDGMNQYAGYHVMHGGVDPTGLWVQKPDEGEHVWCAEEGDTLHDLAAKDEYGGYAENWSCLWPVGDTKDNGYSSGNVAVGDLYDATNLVTPNPNATKMAITVASDVLQRSMRMYGVTHHVRPSRVAEEIQRISGEGATPIESLVVVGHSGYDGMAGWKKGVEQGPWEHRFTVRDLLALDQTPTFQRAKQKKCPLRCWFTRDADARFPGCESAEVMARPFAEKILRRDGISMGTAKKVGFCKNTGRLQWDDVRDNGNKVIKWESSSENVYDSEVWRIYFGDN